MTKSKAKKAANRAAKAAQAFSTAARVAKKHVVPEEVRKSFSLARGLSEGPIVPASASAASSSSSAPVNDEMVREFVRDVAGTGREQCLVKLAMDPFGLYHSAECCPIPDGNSHVVATGVIKGEFNVTTAGASDSLCVILAGNLTRSSDIATATVGTNDGQGVVFVQYNTGDSFSGLWNNWGARGTGTSNVNSVGTQYRIVAGGLMFVPSGNMNLTGRIWAGKTTLATAYADDIIDIADRMRVSDVRTVPIQAAAGESGIVMVNLSKSANDSKFFTLTANTSFPVAGSTDTPISICPAIVLTGLPLTTNCGVIKWIVHYEYLIDNDVSGSILKPERPIPNALVWSRIQSAASSYNRVPKTLSEHKSWFAKLAPVAAAMVRAAATVALPPFAGVIVDKLVGALGY
jgi:hypothetical protein